MNSAPIDHELDSRAVVNASGQPFEKIVVAIHGIGNQIRSSTIRSVARQFGDMESPPLPMMPSSV